MIEKIFILYINSSMALTNEGVNPYLNMMTDLTYKSSFTSGSDKLSKHYTVYLENSNVACFGFEVVTSSHSACDYHDLV